MSKYLVKKVAYSFDGHREPLEGTTEFFTTKKAMFSFLSADEYYSEDVEGVKNKELNGTIETVEEYVNAYIDDDLYAQDGYHCISYKYEAIQLEKELRKEKEALIEQYTQFNNSFFMI